MKATLAIYDMDRTVTRRPTFGAVPVARHVAAGAVAGAAGAARLAGDARLWR